MRAHDPSGPGTDGSRGLDELTVLYRQDLPADEPGDSDPVHDRDPDEDHKESVVGIAEWGAAKGRHDDDHEEQVRERVDDVGNTHENVVDDAADVSGEHPDAEPDREHDRDWDEADDETHSR